MSRATCKKFLILTHPRSGSLFASMVFEGVGLHVSHELDEEHVLKRYGIETYYDGVVTGVFKNCTYDLSRYDVILHQVRNPITAISSSYNCGGMYAVNNIKKFGDGIKPKSVLERHMKSWLVFTDMADRVSCYTYNVEYLKHKIKPICRDILGIPKPVKFRGMMRRYNASRHYQHTWEELDAANHELTEQIKIKAKQYGYKIKNPKRREQ